MIRSESLAAMLGVQLAGFVVVPACLGGLLLLFGGALTPIVWLPTFVLLAMVARCQTKRADPGGSFRAAVLVLSLAAGIALVTLGVVGAFLDTSWDGQAYHLAGVLALADGWNPVWGAPRHHYLVDFVPKSAWFVEALIFAATGSLESGKAVHLIALTATAALWYAAAFSLGLNRWRSAVVAILTALNPIAISQCLTFYVDGLVGSFFSAMLAMTLMWWKTNDRLWLIVLGMTGAFLSTLKFNGLGLAGLLAASLMVAVWAVDRTRLRALLGAGAASVALAVVLGINPYVTSALRYGNPFHPLFGTPEPGIEFVYSRNAAFLAEPAPLRLVTSILARSTNDSERMPRLKPPFTVHIDELGAFTDADTRIGGWGPFFSGALLLAGVLLITSRGAPAASVNAIVQGLICFSVLPAEQSFWARYSAHLWLAPALTLMVGIEAKGRLNRVTSGLLALAMTFDILLVAIPSVGARVLRDAAERRQLADMARMSLHAPLQVKLGLFSSVRNRLDVAGVAYRATENLDCPTPVEMTSSTVAYCLSDGRSPERPLAPLDILRGFIRRPLPDVMD